MKVRMKGKDGGHVVCRINSKNFKPETMEEIPCKEKESAKNM